MKIDKFNHLFFEISSHNHWSPSRIPNPDIDEHYWTFKLRSVMLFKPKNSAIYSIFITLMSLLLPNTKRGALFNSGFFSCLWSSWDVD